MKRHLVIPDTQCKDGAAMHHLFWCADYIREHRPDVIIQLGDFWDMPSLSSWDENKAAMENRRLASDYAAGNDGLDILMGFQDGDPWVEWEDYNPRLIMLGGNHDGGQRDEGTRLYRYVQSNPKLQGVFPDPQEYALQFGWKVVPFKKPIKVDGIYYCHLFCRTSRGTVTAASAKRGASTGLIQLKANMASCTAGHQQGYSYSGPISTIDGRKHGLIAGSFYLHDETYLGYQGNDHWNGIIMKNRVNGRGDYEICPVSIDYLKEKYNV